MNAAASKQEKVSINHLELKDLDDAINQLKKKAARAKQISEISATVLLSIFVIGLFLGILLLVFDIPLAPLVGPIILAGILLITLLWATSDMSTVCTNQVMQYEVCKKAYQDFAFQSFLNRENLRSTYADFKDLFEVYSLFVDLSHRKGEKHQIKPTDPLVAKVKHLNSLTERLHDIRNKYGKDKHL